MKALLRTGLLACLALIATGHLQAQCTNAPSGQWPSSTVTLNNSTSPTTLTTCAYTGEYSVVTGVQSGKSYTVASSISSNYITVTLTDGATIVAHGPQPLTFTATSAANLRIYRHDNAACGVTASSCRTIIMTCNDCTGGGGGCSNSTAFGSATINTAGTPVTISTCSFAGEYSTISGAVSGQTLVFTSSVSTDYITIRSGTAGGPVVAAGNTPLSFNNTFTGTLYAHWNTNSSCGTQSTCRTTTVQCTSCTPPPPPTCPGGLGAGTVNIASLPYNGVGLTNCGNGNNVTSANATVCGSSSYYGGEDRTFIFTPTVSGLYDIVFTTTSTWSGLMLYAGCPFLGQGGSCVAQSQSSSGNKTLNVNLTAGTTYYLVVDAFPAPSCHPSFNLSIALAIPPCSAPGTPVVSNIGSTSASVSWAAAPGASSYDWTLGTGASCPTGSGANTAATSISLSGLVPNTTYRVCVRTSTCGGGAASGYVTTTFTTAPLPNDNCSGAISVSCNSTVTGSTAGALSDAAIGACSVGAGGTPGNGIWYRLAGDGSQVTLDLCASSYDTKVHVYSGSCGGLTCVASNDDSAVCSNSLRSYVVFNTTAGQDYFILVSGFGSATGAFSMSISCACGVPLGAPWATTGIGGASGQAIDNVCGGSIDIQSNGFSSSPTGDRQYLASQTLCGNQTITVRVANVTNSGFAGIAFRESTAAGSRLVGLKTQLVTFVQREIRNATNGFKNTQQLPAPGHSWLRITRNGNTFVGYHSQNGVNWQQAFVTSLALPSCVQVGLFVEGINVNSTASAVFTNVSIGASTLMAPLDAPAEVIASPLEFSLFPNPAQSEINVKMGEEFIGKEVTIRVANQLGQTLLVRRIGEVQHQIETIPLSELSPGVYFVSLQTSSGEVQTQKFVVGANRP